MREPPKRIWLQYYGDGDELIENPSSEDTTWCEDQINNHDVEYVRVGNTGWQPIETAPKDGTVIDLWHKEYGRLCDTWWDAGDGVWAATGTTRAITHWMPIPEEPV